MKTTHSNKKVIAKYAQKTGLLFVEDSLGKLSEDSKREVTKMLSNYLTKKITAGYDMPRDWDVISRHFLHDSKNTLLHLKKRESIENGKKQMSGNVTDQIEILKGMTFLDGISLIPLFQKVVSTIRHELGIDCEKLKKLLNLSDSEIELGTYTASPEQEDAISLSLNGADKVRRRHALAERKQDFEFQLLQSREITSKAKAALHVLHSQFDIPKPQLNHIRNYIFYNLKTGKLLSFGFGGKGRMREWDRRLIGDIQKKSYVPFLRNWLYYHHRVYKHEKSIQKVNKSVVQLGFPAYKREHDYTVLKRYEGYFMKG